MLKKTILLGILLTGLQSYANEVILTNHHNAQIVTKKESTTVICLARDGHRPVSTISIIIHDEVTLPLDTSIIVSENQNVTIACGSSLPLCRVKTQSPHEYYIQYDDSEILFSSSSQAMDALLTLRSAGVCK